MMREKHNHLSVQCAIITVSDTRNKETDKSGQRIREMLNHARHHVNAYKILQDEKEEIYEHVKDMTMDNKVEAIIINGGTGISYRDVTIEAIQPLFDKELPGFGEIFRYLSYEFDIGSPSILSRAACGIANHRVVFSLPGSTGAVNLAMERLILPELGHIVKELKKDIT